MARKTMDEIVASGAPFNPLSGVDGQGRAYSGGTAEKLRATMASHGWDDPRFLTETQIAKLGLTLIPDAQKSMVLHRDGPDGPWDKIFVYNGTQVAGLPSLADMQIDARKALGIGLSMAELVERGTPFNPLSSPDGQGRPYTESNLAALKRAMGEHGWDDPRFLTPAQIAAGGWTIKDGAADLRVWAPGKDGWEEKSVIHASDVIGLPSLETMVKEAAAMQAKALAAAAERGSKEDEFTGVVMNPLSGNGGKVFGGKTAEKLNKAMAANGWSDGRFVTKGQAEYAGMVVPADAQAVIVNLPGPKGFVPVSLYNAAVVAGMPTMAEMYTKVANLPSVEHAAMILDGEPVDPLAVNPNALHELKGGRDTLVAAMENHAWDDPRFVSFGTVDAWTQKLTVSEGEKPIVVDGVKLYNVAQLEGLPELPNLPAWQEMHYQNSILEKEQRKERDFKECTNTESLSSLPGSVVRLNGESHMVEVLNDNGETISFGGKPAIETFAADVGLSEADKKRMFGLETLANALGKSGKAIDDVLVVTDGRHIGPVLGMKDDKAIIDSGRGNLVGLDTAKLDKPPKPGETVDVSLTNGIVKAFKNLGDQLSQDGQAVSVAMHTR